MNSAIREVILVPTASVVPANLPLYNTDGELAVLNDAINVGDIVFYDPRTNKTVGAGVLPTQVPRLGVAVVSDVMGNNQPTLLKKVFGGYFDKDNITTYKAEIPSYGCNDIVDFVGKCTRYGTTYSLQIETQGNEELMSHHDNHWSKWFYTVELADYRCDSCDDTVDPKLVFCALANKINAHKGASNAERSGYFLKRAKLKMNRDRMFDAYALFANDYIFEMSHATPVEGCTTCTHFTGINGITIGTNDPMVFNTASLIETANLSLVEKRDRIIALINKAFRDTRVEGSAVIDTQLVGSGSPCTDFKIRINSCATVTLQDAEGENLPSTTTNPFTDLVQDPTCIGCGFSETTWTPTAGLRVVSRPAQIICDCYNPVDRRLWYHRKIRITLPESHNWEVFAMRHVQTSKPPINLGSMWRKRMIDMNSSGLGYENMTIENTGLYQTPKTGTALTESFKGLGCKDAVCSINVGHKISYQEKSVNGALHAARGKTVFLINHSNTSLYTAVTAVLNPWFTALGFTPASCTVDHDQIGPFMLDEQTNTYVPTDNVNFHPNAGGGDLTTRS